MNKKRNLNDIDYCEENPILQLILVQCQLEFYTQLLHILHGRNINSITILLKSVAFVAWRHYIFDGKCTLNT